MRQGDIEVEVKLAVGESRSARQTLLAAGAATTRERSFEDNVLLDTADRLLARRGRLLRIRFSADRAWLTFKEPPPPERVEPGMKVATERECELAPDEARALQGILRSLGYEPAYRYQKYREEFALRGLTVTLDETPIGTFLELEGPPDTIRDVARLLGHGPESFIKENYRALHARRCAEQGLPMGDMVFDASSDR